MPNNLSSLSHGRAGQLVLGVLIVLLVLLGSLLYILLSPEDTGARHGGKDGNYYERDQTILEWERDTTTSR
jgi:hypothetical protein